MAQRSDRDQEFRLVSSCLDHEGRMPRKFTYEGQGAKKDESPPLEWYDAPDGTESFALIFEDPDAPDPSSPLVPWTHWVMINIPASVRAIPANFSSKNVDEKSELSCIQEGLNDWKVPGYRGPHPPTGTHRYVFKLYALDTTLQLGNKVTKDKVMEAIEGHVLGVAELAAYYGREKFRTVQEFMPPGGPKQVGTGWPRVIDGTRNIDHR